ncbi:hypothetical protein DFJ74DRAFT_701850 [Hyaloraphidium curvatum]|nr:hypothetical protein DFJ74DRAFT_701850 [Hyaloraphidium curvatum]
MGIVRSLLGPGERAIRAKAIADRMFWQQPSDVPVFLRGRGDKGYYTVSYGLALGGVLYAFVCAAQMALRK